MLTVWDGQPSPPSSSKTFPFLHQTSISFAWFFRGRCDQMPIHPVKAPTNGRSKKRFHPSPGWWTNGCTEVTYISVGDSKAAASPAPAWVVTHASHIPGAPCTSCKQLHWRLSSPPANRPLFIQPLHQPGKPSNFLSSPVLWVSLAFVLGTAFRWQCFRSEELTTQQFNPPLRS